MRQGETFGDLLERELARVREPEPRPAAAWQNWNSAAQNPLLFVTSAVLESWGKPLPTVRQPASSAPAGAPASERPPVMPISHVRTAAPTPDQGRPIRILMARERRALRELIALGADLQPDFTVQELRRAFRILARRYHPDCHPDNDQAATAELSRSFAALAENYRCLKAVGESVGPIRH
jgi:hypothetical protein